MTTKLPTPVEQVARLIQGFNQEQKLLLLQLVPELQTLSILKADIPEEQANLMDYFQAKMEALLQRTPLQADDIFVGDSSPILNLRACPFGNRPNAIRPSYLSARPPAILLSKLVGGVDQIIRLQPASGNQPPAR